MKIIGGVLKMTKTERKEFLELIKHSEIDLNYGSGGTFNKDNPETTDYDFDEKEAGQVRNAIKNLKWILENYD